MPLDVELRKITEMAAQLRRAATKFRGKWRKERYAHGKELRTAIFAKPIVATAKKLLLLTVHDLNSFANCFHGCEDNSLRRVRLDVSEASSPRFAQLLAVREGEPQNICQC